MTEFLTPTGRIVQGHPMIMYPVKDRQGVQKINKAGNPQEQCFVGLAIPKGAEASWKDTEWGAKLAAAAATSYPNGESGSPLFAFKVTDGDSTVPNKKGTPPCAKEGFPGHWVLGASNGFPPQCYADGNYSATVMQKDRFKTGDYARILVEVAPNNSTESPGMYVNLKACELVQAGPAIETASSVDAQGTFGATAPVVPANAMADTVTAPPVPQAPPSMNLSPAPVMTAQATCSYEQYKEAGWTDEQMVQAGFMAPSFK